MFKLKTKPKLKVRVKGWLQTPIQYEVRVPTSNWSAFFGKYQNQKWGGWDSDSCWCLSAINSVEDQMEWLWKNNMFSAEAKSFFTDNGYIDSDGDISLSERFHEILCGNGDAGGTSEEAWQSFQKRGFIPRSMLNYSLEQSQKWTTKAQFNSDYFNTSVVTPAMRILGLKALQYINISYQKIGNGSTTPNIQILKAALEQAPINIGIPVPKDVQQWNNIVVYYDGSRKIAHEVELYGINDDGSYLIFDQYLPNLKTLSTGYYAPLCTQGIITAVAPISTNPIPQPSNSDFWTAVMNFWNGVKNSILVGSAKRVVYQ